MLLVIFDDNKGKSDFSESLDLFCGASYQICKLDDSNDLKKCLAIVQNEGSRRKYSSFAIIFWKKIKTWINQSFIV